MVKAIQFHRITPKFQFCGTWNRPDQFDVFLSFIRCWGIKTIVPGEADSGIIITFDDGDESIYQHAFPVLKKYNIKAMVFLIVDCIGAKGLWDITLTGKHSQHLTWDEILEMKQWGIHFGSHTMSHRNLTKLSDAEIDYELYESKQILEEKIGGIDSISYPFNRCNEKVVKRASYAGYKFGFGGLGDHKLTMLKEAIYITDNLKSFRTKIFERPKLLYKYERIKQKVINYFTIATMLSSNK